jgi:hypothetical protein
MAILSTTLFVDVVGTVTNPFLEIGHTQLVALGMCRTQSGLHVCTSCSRFASFAFLDEQVDFRSRYVGAPSVRWKSQPWASNRQQVLRGNNVTVDAAAATNWVGGWTICRSTMRHPHRATICHVWGCQGISREDPLTGAAFTATLNGFTYSPQQAIFYSQSRRMCPRFVVTDGVRPKGTFQAPAAACP